MIRSCWLVAVLFAVGVHPAAAQSETADREASTNHVGRDPVRVRIHWRNQQRLFEATGNAVGIHGDTLILGRSDSAVIDRVSLPDLTRIDISRGYHRHGLRGAQIGAVVGIVLAVPFLSDPWIADASNSFAPALTIMTGAAAGALTGSGIGALIRTERWTRVEVEELRRLLQGALALPGDPESPK